MTQPLTPTAWDADDNKPAIPKIPHPRTPQATEPSDLAVAVDLGRRVLDSGNPVALCEALRLVLRALDTEGSSLVRTPGGDPVRGASEKVFTEARENPSGQRCPAAFTDDAAACDGPPVVLILDPNNRGAEACEHHGARLLAVIKDGRPVALPDAPEGTASRVFKAAASLRYFAGHQGGGR
ncbi:hypothetical protein [Streptomyces sp. NPDC006640]|uniref:hypothetical protein n=1 Tax=unclassified Streptomyces TaxID=2593676 RepID=UPI00367B3863